MKEKAFQKCQNKFFVFTVLFLSFRKAMWLTSRRSAWKQGYICLAIMQQLSTLPCQWQTRETAWQFGNAIWHRKGEKVSPCFCSLPRAAKQTCVFWTLAEASGKMAGKSVGLPRVGLTFRAMATGRCSEQPGGCASYPRDPLALHIYQTIPEAQYKAKTPNSPQKYYYSLSSHSGLSMTIYIIIIFTQINGLWDAK